jgi:hypothetical protein
MNPYKVLGVSENASQEEIRKAYLALVKKYHPDRYADGPMKDLANEKLKEINQAYELLTKKKETSGYGGSSSYGGYSSYGQNAHAQGGYWQNQGSYSGEYAQEFSRVRSYFSQNNLNAARAVLDGIPLHNAEWHYLYGILYFRWGWYDQARQHLSMACNMEPGNMEYQNAYATVMNTGRGYHSGPLNMGGQDCDMCDWCTTMLCLNCLCNCGGCH